MNVGSGHVVADTDPARQGNRHPSIVPYQPYRTADSVLAIAAASPALWEKFCVLLGRDGWLADDRFVDNGSRILHADELEAEVEAVLSTKLGGASASAASTPGAQQQDPVAEALANGTWKEKKDGGRPVAAVFVADVSGSMEGTRILALRQAMYSGADFITPENSVGLVTFSDEITQVLPVEQFDLNQKGRFVAAADEMSAGGGTAMYDGVALGLQMLADEVATNPDVKPLLFVLSDGETTDGRSFDDMRAVIEGVGIPVYTVGFEANVDELGRLAALVEAASLDANEDDIEYKIGSMFNAEL